MDIRNLNPISLTRPPRPESILERNNEPGKASLSFETVLGQALDGVNTLQQQAGDMNTQLASGKLENIHEATVMAEKASLAFDLTLQVRNKVIEAYQEVMRTQI